MTTFFYVQFYAPALDMDITLQAIERPSVQYALLDLSGVRFVDPTLHHITRGDARQAGIIKSVIHVTKTMMTALSLGMRPSQHTQSAPTGKECKMPHVSIKQRTIPYKYLNHTG